MLVPYSDETNNKEISIRETSSKEASNKETSNKECFGIIERKSTRLYKAIAKRYSLLRPVQKKAIKAGLLDNKSLLVCSPTASGKTFVAELAMLNAVLERGGIAAYIAPLKAIASEKYRSFKKRYPFLKTALSIGNSDSPEHYLGSYDFIVTTTEKLDSLIRHKAQWVSRIKAVVFDEIHLLNDPGRGPVAEVLVILLKRLLPSCQFIALSATIGNPEELAEWLGAKLVKDSWRPVKLKLGVSLDSNIEFFE